MKTLKNVIVICIAVFAACNPPDYPSPEILKVTPGKAAPDSLFVIDGNFLYLTQSLYLDTIRIKDFTYDPEKKYITAFVPVRVIPKVYTLYAVSGTGRSNGISFTVTNPPPFIESINPLSANAKDTLTITGLNFENKNLEIHIGTIVISQFVLVSLQKLKVVLPADIKSGMLNVVNTTGKSNNVYFNLTGDPSSPYPIITNVDKFGSVGGTIVINGNHFVAGKMSVVFPSGLSLDEKTGVKVNSTTSMQFNIPEGATSGVIKIKNEYGEAGFQLEVILPPSISRILPGSNAKGGPMFIYGQNLKHVSGIRFGNSSVSSGYNYHLTNENEEILSLTVPAVAPGSQNVKVQVNNQLQSNAILYTVNSGSMTLPSYLPNLVVPDVPPASTLNNINNQWIRMGRTSRYGLNIDRVNDDYWIIIDFSNRNLGVIDLHKNSFVLDGYYGKFDRSYSTNEDVAINRIILTPINQGNQVEMIFPFYLESISPPSAKQGDSITIKGRYFLDGESVTVLIGDQEIDLSSTRTISENLMKIKIPETIRAGDYKLRVVADFNSSNSRMLKVLSK